MSTMAMVSTPIHVLGRRRRRRRRRRMPSLIWPCTRVHGCGHRKDGGRGHGVRVVSNGGGHVHRYGTGGGRGDGQRLSDACHQAIVHRVHGCHGHCHFASLHRCSVGGGGGGGCGR